ncbi:Oidioi.mRNA.OKI2018_I69.XSR.g15121.t1.cds [Oikopleura dioica]|uniref:Oidioi.mRNA.OKI2018_I69.XSR.g15121.t1.cds n=1 Tax=Oikopleura dioica TaxID=34765 RepID=A0ABN7SDK9_OIKDI|nr:Oidioi.mRNA.OKI2018_I69.XSR.g15121.t1.cds [Oikopleura dioica]
MTGAWRVRLVSNRPGTPVRRRRRTVSDSSLNTDRFLTQVERDALGPVKPRSNTSVLPPLVVLDNPDEDRIERLREHCQCTICLDLPEENDAIYQCQMGHIYCQFCLARLIADGVIIGGGAHCATCRSTLDWKHVVRVRAIEMMARELPKDCEYCNMTVQNTTMSAHREVCAFKTIECDYKWAGCTWKGRRGQSLEHIGTCDVGQMPLSQTLESAKSAIQLVKNKGNKVQQLLKLYTSANCWMQDIYMKAYRVSEYGPGKLRFISPEFVALDISWQMTGTIVSVEKNPSRPTHGEDRSVEIQLTARGLSYDEVRSINFIILKSPKSIVEIIPSQHKHRFDHESPSSEKYKVHVKENSDYNRLIGAQGIYLRVVLFEDRRASNNNAEIDYDSFVANLPTSIDPVL